jgi:hypothetical protein
MKKLGMLSGLCALLLAVTSAHAATKYWVPGNVGSFATGTNWSGGTVPASNDTVYVNSGTATMDSQTYYAAGFYLMRTNTPGHTAYFNMNNSTMYQTANSAIGQGVTNTTAILSLTNSTMNTRTFYVGHSGVNMTNVMNLKASTMNVGVNLILSATSNSLNVLNLTDNSVVSVATNVTMGWGGGVKTMINIEGGSRMSLAALSMGTAAGSTGIVNVAANSSLTMSGGNLIGQAVGGYGELNINGGSVTGANFFVGNQSSGALNMNGGNLKLTGGLNLAWYNNSETGALSASNGAVISVDSMNVGGQPTSTASVVLSGADVSFDIATTLLATNSNATFTFNILDTNGVSTINAAGNILLAGADLVINGNISNILNNVLFTGNSVTGTFATVLINGQDGSSLIGYGADSISIIPEPTTVGLFVVSSVGLILLRRVRGC